MEQHEYDDLHKDRETRNKIIRKWSVERGYNAKKVWEELNSRNVKLSLHTVRKLVASI